MCHIEAMPVFRPRTSPRVWTNSCARVWTTFGTNDQRPLRPTCPTWLLRRTLLSYPVMRNHCTTQVRRRVLGKRFENKQVGTDVEEVSTRLTINVGSTNRTLPNENFRACERRGKKRKRPSGRSEAVVEKELRSIPTKKQQTTKKNRASTRAA